MTVTVKRLNTPSQLTASDASIYAAPAATSAIVDKCTVTNTTASAATLTINKINSAGSASASNTIVSARSVAPGECYLCPEIVGHILLTGDFISAKSGTASALTIAMSGREIT